MAMLSLPPRHAIIMRLLLRAAFSSAATPLICYMSVVIIRALMLPRYHAMPLRCSLRHAFFVFAISPLSPAAAAAAYAA